MWIGVLGVGDVGPSVLSVILGNARNEGRYTFPILCFLRTPEMRSTWLQHRFKTYSREPSRWRDP